MKVLAINGSPNGKRGNTEKILDSFMQGAKQGHAETETIYLNEKRIAHCTGCYTCWRNTPGVCIHKDDMPELLEKVKDADILVYATPLYFFTVTGLMKDFMDRMLPLSNPEMHLSDEGFVHSSRYTRRTSEKTVLITNCGFPGQNNFTGLLETFKILTRGQLSAAIMRSQGGMLSSPQAAGWLAPYFSAVRDAGRQVVENGTISPETQAVLDRDLLDPDVYAQYANRSWGQ